MKSILDRSFRYVPSYSTDLRKTFERIRRERSGLPPAQSAVPIKREQKAYVHP